jgi:copper(I)-binding protein
LGAKNSAFYGSFYNLKKLKMRPVALLIGQKQTFYLEPGDAHTMSAKLASPLESGCIYTLSTLSGENLLNTNQKLLIVQINQTSKELSASKTCFPN